MLAQLADEIPRFFTYWNILFLAQAALNTLLVSFVGCFIGYAVGFLLATMRSHRIVPLAPVRLLGVAYVEAFRRIPFLVLLLCTFFGFQLSGADASLFTIAVTAVAVRMAALAAENIRAGYEAIGRTQWEAAETMNLRPLQTLRLVILPQAWRVILPPSIIHTVSMIKETALVVQIGFLELTFAARMLTQRGFSPILCYGSVLLLYFVISWSFATLGRRLETRLTSRESMPREAALPA
jgi:polar amino acid transport system permease protein